MARFRRRRDAIGGQRPLDGDCQQLVDRADAMPTPKELLARGERWGPYRTYASLYLWRIADANKTPVKRSQD